MQENSGPGNPPADAGTYYTVFSVQVVEFGDVQHDDTAPLRMHEAMYEIVSAAFDAAGVPWSEVVYEYFADRMLVIVPDRFPESVLIDPLNDRLRDGMHAYYRDEGIRVRLRTALHTGLVYEDLPKQIVSGPLKPRPSHGDAPDQVTASPTQSESGIEFRDRESRADPPAGRGLRSARAACRIPHRPAGHRSASLPRTSPPGFRSARRSAWSSGSRWTSTPTPGCVPLRCASRHWTAP